MKKIKNACRFILPVSAFAGIIAGIIMLIGSHGMLEAEKATNGFGIFDLKFSYTLDNISTVISKFNGDPQEFLQGFYITNCIFEVLFTIAAISASILLDCNDKFYLIYRSSIFSAFAHGFFDIVENILLMKIINNFPYFTGNDANFVSGMTSIKWVFFWIWVFSTLILAVIAIIHNMRINSKPKSKYARKK